MAELLKEAIADAKAVREVALQNAKMALEEAFDSKIKNMLSAKLAEEIEEDVELEEVYEEDDVTSEGDTYEEDDVTTEEVELEEDIDEEINLDELMAELEEMSYENDVTEGEEESLEEEEDELLTPPENLDESLNEWFRNFAVNPAQQNFSNILKGITKKFKGDYEGWKKAVIAAGEEVGYAGAEAIADSPRWKAAISDTKETVDRTDESFDIDALIAEIESELEEGKKKKEKDDEKDQMKKELAEALSTVNSLKSTISEMNLLNSKLLYCNKLFRANALTEAQKVKVIDALDKSATTGEAKLVFETLQESFAFTGVEKRAIKEGLGRASKASGVAPKKVIMESTDETVSRFQKLANIKL